jgi:alcohol dehydrogenase (cytochrome c)
MRLAISVYLSALTVLLAQPDLPAARKRYEAQCAGCHGADAAGGERGPTLFREGILRPDDQLRDIIRAGRPAAGMPAFDLPEPALAELIGYIKTLRPSGPRGVRISPALLEKIAATKAVPFTEVVSPRPGNWPSYHGQITGNRHSSLDQINVSNVSQLALRWLHTVPGVQRLELTPVVIDGIMYLTAPNSAFAVDARSGKLIWRFQQPRTKGVIGDAGSGINRGVAILGDSVFLVTDHAHILCLDRKTGQVRWDREMADYRQHYGATAAPLIVNDLVISGVSGGDEGVRGFLAAFKASTGEEVWRFWTVPAPGDPEAKTWIGKAIEHGCAATWMTGTYDASTTTLYWTTGNPCPDYNGDERKGDNLYSDSVLALNPATGKLKWFYQYTPHDLHDWDAQQTPMLIDARFRGRDRKLLAQANRNGFFYVLDRLTGEVLVAKPFVKKMTWASGIGPDGRPQVIPGTEPTPEGVQVCPAVEGATNWFSTAFHPGTGLFYVMSLEKCSIYTKSSTWWQRGDSFYGGGTRRSRDETPQKLLRAIDIETGEIKWELPQDGPANTWGGVLSTAGGVVFFGNDNGSFSAADAKSGRALWHFEANQNWKASPMTFAVDGTQYVAIAGGPNVLVFALPPADKLKRD